MVALTVGHVGIVVQDLPRMRDFYTRVLGLTETRRLLREGPCIDGLTGLRNVKLEAVILGMPDRPAAVELLKYHRHPSPTVPRGPNRLGVNHVQFAVDDLDPILEALRAEGLDPWGEPQDWPDTWSRSLYAKDPEGNVLEFNEIKPGALNPDLGR